MKYVAIILNLLYIFSGKALRQYTLCVCFKYGAIYFMNNYDDVCPKIAHTMLTGTSHNPYLCMCIINFEHLMFHRMLVDDFMSSLYVQPCSRLFTCVN